MPPDASIAFLMIKPCAVSDGHIGDIVAAVERADFSIVGIASRRLTRPAFSEYPPTDPSLIALTAPSLMCSGVPAVGLAQERKATSSTAFDSRVISWMADFGI